MSDLVKRYEERERTWREMMGHAQRDDSDIYYHVAKIPGLGSYELRTIVMPNVTDKSAPQKLTNEYRHRIVRKANDCVVFDSFDLKKNANVLRQLNDAIEQLRVIETERHYQAVEKKKKEAKK